MRKSGNSSYDRIINYIYNTPELSQEDKRFLLHYASHLIMNKVENAPDESIEEILDGIRLFNEAMKRSVRTSIVEERLEREIHLLNMINEYYKGNDNKEQIGYELDKLYLESDMGIRRSSSLSHSLEKKDTKNRSR